MNYRAQPILTKFAIFSIRPFLSRKTDEIAPALLLKVELVSLKLQPLFLALVDQSLEDKSGLATKTEHEWHQQVKVGLVLEGGLARLVVELNEVGEAGHCAEQSEHDREEH